MRLEGNWARPGIADDALLDVLDDKHKARTNQCSMPVHRLHKHSGRSSDENEPNGAPCLFNVKSKSHDKQQTCDKELISLQHHCFTRTDLLAIFHLWLSMVVRSQAPTGPDSSPSSFRFFDQSDRRRHRIHYRSPRRMYKQDSIVNAPLLVAGTAGAQYCVPTGCCV